MEESRREWGNTPGRVLGRAQTQGRRESAPCRCACARAQVKEKDLTHDK